MEGRLGLFVFAPARIRKRPVEDPVGHSYDRLLRQLVGDSQTGSEVHGIRFGETARDTIKTCELDLALRDAACPAHIAWIRWPATVVIWPVPKRVKVPDAVPCLQERRIVLVAQSEV